MQLDSIQTIWKKTAPEVEVKNSNIGGVFFFFFTTVEKKTLCTWISKGGNTISWQKYKWIDFFSRKKVFGGAIFDGKKVGPTKKIFLCVPQMPWKPPSPVNENSDPTCTYIFFNIVYAWKNLRTCWILIQNKSIMQYINYNERFEFEPFSLHYDGKILLSCHKS